MIAEISLKKRLMESLGRSHCVLCGRGTTALWLALRAIMRRDGPGEVILPDVLCSVALDGVLLAGFTPVFADVLPGRLTLAADYLAPLITPNTRAILVAHLFGHVADMDLIRQAAPGIPIIEDAVQGFGGSYRGKPVGSWGDLAFVSFDKNKMIGGRGGALLFDDDALNEGIEADLYKFANRIVIFGDAESLTEKIAANLCKLPNPTALYPERVASLPGIAAAAYASQLTAVAPHLLCRFDSSAPNMDRILADCKTLGARVAARNAKARLLQARLADLPLLQPEIRASDAIWRYTITAPNATWGRRIIRGLQLAGIGGSSLYYPLSSLFGQQSGVESLAHRLINLFVDEATDDEALRRTAEVIAAAPWSRFSPG